MRENPDLGTGWIDRQKKSPAGISPLGNNQESAGKNGAWIRRHFYSYSLWSWLLQLP